MDAKDIGQLQQIIYNCKNNAKNTIRKSEAEENAEIYREVIQTHNIPSQYLNAKFTDYNFPKKSIITGYLRNLKENTKNGIGLFVTGDTGTGKTRLCYAYMKKYIWDYIRVKNSKEVCYISFNKLHADIINAEKSDQSNIKKTYAGYKLLIVDEFAVKDLTDAQVDNFLEILNIRNHNKPCGKPTVIISNQNLESIKESAGGAIYSRIKGNSVVYHMNSEDKRSIKNRLKLD
jgi:DNA replication protein DnaC